MDLSGAESFLESSDILVNAPAQVKIAVTRLARPLERIFD
jgi:hypothetical protein